MDTIKKLIQESAAKVDVKEDVEKLLESFELSEELAEKMQTVLEATIKSKVSDVSESHVQKLIEDSEKLLDEKVSEEIKGVQDLAAKYLDTIGETWLKENKQALEKSIKSKLFESLVESLKETFTEHNIVVSEDKVDIVEELNDAIEESKTQINAMIDQNSELKKELSELKQSIDENKKQTMISKMTASLSEESKQKASEMAQVMTFGEDFEKKFGDLVSYISESKKEEPAKEEKASDELQEPLEESLNYSKTEDEEIVEDEQEKSRKSMMNQALSIL